MNARITITVCAFVAMMNHASAAIVDVDALLNAFALWSIPGYPEFLRRDERTETFSGYGSFDVGAYAVPADPESPIVKTGVAARVQPNAFRIRTAFSLGTRSQDYLRAGTATAVVNFDLSEAGVWSATPFVTYEEPSGRREGEISLFRNEKEVYRQECSGFDGMINCDPDYVGTSLIELQQGDYTLSLTANQSNFTQDQDGGEFGFELQLVPVPAALPLFISALAAFGLLGWRRR